MLYVPTDLSPGSIFLILVPLCEMFCRTPFPTTSSQTSVYPPKDRPFRSLGCVRDDPVRELRRTARRELVLLVGMVRLSRALAGRIKINAPEVRGRRQKFHPHANAF